MDDDDLPRYWHSATNRTRDFNRALVAGESEEPVQAPRRRSPQKRAAIEPIPGAKDPPKRRKGQRGQWQSQLPATDRLAALDSAPSKRAAARTSRSAASSISRATSNDTDRSAAPPPPDSDDDMSDMPGMSQTAPGASRFTAAIGPETDLLQGLPATQAVNMFGMPILQAELPQEDDGLTDIARNVSLYDFWRDAF